MRKRTEEINSAIAAAKGQLSRRDAKALVANAAVAMNLYVTRVRADLPLFRDALSKGADAAARAALMRFAVASENRNQVRQARAELSSFADAITGAYEGMDFLRVSVQQLPRMTTVLNRSKRETSDALGEVTESLAAGRRLIIEAVKALDGLLGNSGDE
jgi:hypothetical protein